MNYLWTQSNFIPTISPQRKQGKLIFLGQGRAGEVVFLWRSWEVMERPWTWRSGLGLNSGPGRVNKPFHTPFSPSIKCCWPTRGSRMEKFTMEKCSSRDWKDRCAYWWDLSLIFLGEQQGQKPGSTPSLPAWPPSPGDLALLTSPHSPRNLWLLKYWKFPEHTMLFQASVTFSQFY